MKKIRVGFLLNVSENWIGGLNYFRNLILTIVKYKDLGVEPIIFIGKDTDVKLFKDFSGITIIKTNLLTRWDSVWILRKIIGKFTGTDFLLDRFLKQHKIDIVSHLLGMPLDMNLPTCAWIPDFQHKHLPRLFSQNELRDRDHNFTMLAEKCDTVILSSQNARCDFIRFFEKYEYKAEVLRFVVSTNMLMDTKQKVNIREKYNINSRYFYLPNQYWEHKNHKIVLDALLILKKQERYVLVVSSGNTEDYRNKTHFSLLEKFIKDYELENYYYILGKIPYPDVQALSKDCFALINPSLFEGWSTTVEEAKSLGKRILLSNIPVHLEQCPERGKFFDPMSPVELAKEIWAMWNEHSRSDIEIDVKVKNENRQREFIYTYKNILLSTINRFAEKRNGEDK